MASRHTILIVDDEPNARKNVRKALSKEDVLIDEVNNSTELINKLKIESFDLVILDLEMPNFKFISSITAGFECLDYLKEYHPDIPVIVFSELDSMDFIREAFSRGAFDYVGKSQPRAQKELFRSVNRALNERLARMKQSTVKPPAFVRIEQKIADEYRLLVISEEKLRRIGDSKLSETKLQEIHKLENQELQERLNLQKIEQTIRDLFQSLGEFALSFQDTQVKEDSTINITPKIQIVPTLQYDILPVGVYHLLEDVSDLPLVAYKITNDDNKDCSIIVTSYIERYSDHHTDTVEIKAGSTFTLRHIPVLIPEAVGNLTQITTATLHATVKRLSDGQERIISDISYRIKLHATETMPLVLKNLATGQLHDLTSLIAAWVTPHIPNIEALLRKAIEHHPNQSIVGYQGGGNSAEEKAAFTRSQIKAMFESLKNEGKIKYLSSTISFGQKADEVMQRIRLPRKSLTLSVANCIDGSVLFASLIESADMNPLIVLVPGHAFVGWETWDSSNIYEYLETTMIGSSSFEEAWQVGIDQFAEGQQLGHVSTIRIKDLRKRGILPME